MGFVFYNKGYFLTGHLPIQPTTHTKRKTAETFYQSNMIVEQTMREVY